MLSKESYTNKFNEYVDSTGEVGFVEMVTPPLCYVNGIPGANVGEVIHFESGHIGQIMALNRDNAEVLLFSDDTLPMGVKAARAGELLKVPISESLLGLSIDPLGQPIYDDAPLIRTEEGRTLENKVLGIAHREKIDKPFLTGVTLVDLLVPMGKGQRELVIGDRKTGKTIFLLQTMLTQASMGTICIYAGIGKKKADIRKVEAFVTEKGFRDRCIVVATGASSPLGMIYINPYSAMSIAEFFRDRGHEVVVIFDDLTTHAKAYREMSLLGKRFPGRGSYPGDIFYLHARLLERGGNYKIGEGPKSITCLPVAETIEGDISGYIQTNLMSITDGHIFFDTDMFKEGRRPAVNNFLSVTRVGRQTQSKLRWAINREVESFLVLYNKTLDFVHFGAELNEGIQSTLSMGEKILAFLDQPMGRVFEMKVQLLLFGLIWSGVIHIKDAEDVKVISEMCTSYYKTDEGFRNLVEEIIVENEDLNAFLGRLGQNSQKLNTYFKERLTLNKS